MESRPPVQTDTPGNVRSPLDLNRLTFKSATDRPARVRGRLSMWVAASWLILITVLA